MLGLAAGALAACSVPNFEGPQIQDPPQGFLLVPDSYQQRRLFPQRPLAFHSAWIESVQDFSTIYIDGYAGVFGLEDAMAARDSAVRHAIDPATTFGEVEPITVDDRRGFGWAERLETPTRGLVWVAYRAVVPYDTVTYTVEVYSGHPSIKRAAPDTLKAIIQTFAVGETTLNIPLIAGLIVAALLAAGFARSKQRDKASRLRSINLVKVPKKATEEPAAAPQSTPPAQAPPAIPDWRSPSSSPAPAPRAIPDWRTPKSKE